MKIVNKILGIVFILFFFVSCASITEHQNVEEKKDIIQKMKSDTLGMLLKENPEIKSKIQSSPGYAVFSNINSDNLEIDDGIGYGITIDNVTGDETYMVMTPTEDASKSEYSDFRVVLIFKDRGVFQRCVKGEWSFKIGKDDPEVYLFTTEGIVRQKPEAFHKYVKHEQLKEESMMIPFVIPSGWYGLPFSFSF